MEKTIESFITQCDDMMIAEESLSFDKIIGLAITDAAITAESGKVKEYLQNIKSKEVHKKVKPSSEKTPVTMSDRELKLHNTTIGKLCVENAKKQLPKLKLNLDKKYHIILTNNVSIHDHGKWFEVEFLYCPEEIQSDIPECVVAARTCDEEVEERTLNEYMTKYYQCLQFMSSQCRTIIGEYSKQLGIPHTSYSLHTKKLEDTFYVHTGDGDDGAVYIEYIGDIDN